jgi:hypothetical protein
MTEHVLGGGNVAAGVVRVGDTGRKPAGFWTPAVEALLAHLRRAGFTGAADQGVARLQRRVLAAAWFTLERGHLAGPR